LGFWSGTTIKRRCNITERNKGLTPSGKERKSIEISLPKDKGKFKNGNK